MTNLRSSPERRRRGYEPDRFRNILVVAHRSMATTREMVATARALAAPSATVTVFDALAPLGARRQSFEYRHGVFDPEMFAVEHRHLELEALVRPTPDHSINVEVATGVTHELAVEAVKRRGHDLVMVGPDPSELLVRVLQPLTATPLLRTLAVPVWIQSGSRSGPGDVAVELGPPDDRAEGRWAQNGPLVEVAASITRRLGCRLHVIATCVLDHDEIGVADPSSCRDRMMTRHVAEYARLVTYLERSAHELHMAHGTTGSALLRFIEQHDPRVVVVGRTPRRGLDAALHPCPAERVVERVGRSSVVTVNLAVSDNNRPG